tara:strand:- start:297 stop:998 length:702 start_codon:yes stop_codon:yes gene_type:complete
MPIGRPVSLTPNVASKNLSVTATAGQTLFQPVGGYRVNQLGVFRNGTRLVDGQDFTARDGASVTLLSASTVGDVIEFQIFDSFNIVDAIGSNGNQTIDGTLIVQGGVTGSQIGIQSGGTAIGTGRTINFIGSGNTVVDKGDGTIDVSISGSGSGGGGLGTAINYSDDTTATPFSYIDTIDYVSEDLMLDTTKAGTSNSYIVSINPQLVVNSGVAVTVGAGKTMVVDVLRIGDL